MPNSFERVVELLKLESEAIERASSRLDADAVHGAVRLIAECKGKVVVTGVGKSGVIAQKIAQTMTSTGTVTVYVHPSDAVHGSLGMISPGDVALALSNSGETDEIVSLLPSFEKRDVSLISIVGNLDSTLARCSDVALDASVDKEACPLNLAPTTSTTVALSIGDAIAMTVMESKGLTEEDFARNHPAGRLGKRLTLKVESLMHESPSISPEAGWLEIVKTISKHTLGAVNVVAGDGRLEGIITDGDLRRTIEHTSAAELENLSARSMMTADPVTTSPDALAYEALRLMEERDSQISELPVVRADGNCIGLVRLHDLVRSGL